MPPPTSASSSRSRKPTSRASASVPAPAPAPAPALAPDTATSDLSRSATKRKAPLPSGAGDVTIRPTAPRGTALAPAEHLETLRVPISPGQTLVFGRKPTTTSLPSLPHSSNHKVHPLRLPSTFTHASRTHCTCTLTQPPLGGLTLTVSVVGMNGVLVDDERFEKGMSAGVELKRKDGEEIELGFWAGKRVICEVKLEELGDGGRATRGAVRGSQPPSPAPKLRPDSKRKATAEEGSTAVAAPVRGSPSKKPRRGSPPPVLPPAPLPPLDPAVLELPIPERARASLATLQPDFAELLAASIVFASTASVPTSQVVRGVLEIQPRMAEIASPRNTPDPSVKPESPGSEAKEPRAGSEGAGSEDGEGEGEGGAKCQDRLDRAVEAWAEVVLEALQRESRDGRGMFGCITNQGLKDAAGHPLEAYWYYQPQNDPDGDRRQRLQPYVKKLRHTQTTSKQYFFKKVRGNRRKS